MRVIGLTCLMALTCVLSYSAESEAVPATEAHPQQLASDPYMGDWHGEWDDTTPLCAQVMALGKGSYQANFLAEFDKRAEPIAVLTGTVVKGSLVFLCEVEGVTWGAAINCGVLEGRVTGKKRRSFSMKRAERLSPSLGTPPPPGAIVLFDGRSLANWEHPITNSRQLDLKAALGGDDRVAYLRSEVWSPEEQPVLFEIGSDDGVKVWLNGAEIHAKNVFRGVKPGDDKVPAEFREGPNRVLFKVSQGSGGWGTCLRIRTPEGNDIQGLEVASASDSDARVPLETTEGYVMDWQVSGPYVEEGKRAMTLFNFAFSPETDEGEPEWRTMPKPAEEDPVCRWKLLDNGVMEVRNGTILSKQRFTDHRVHVEFCTPFMPDAREQGRGNSGVYLQGRYEVQILDSYGLEGEWNECGGIYKVAKPLVNMCAPPLQWQTYDIVFRAPRFDGSGNRTRDGLLTVYHDGVLIHENIAVPTPTTAASNADVRQPGGLLLQDHGNPVQFRNIWAVEMKE